ncbi:polysaccharide lyase family 8 super-sandwich domain-containing protein [Flavobacterium gilvum]|uniref:Uncharacterized protein n=1 Tax=Flavobacterium gilvum TaxID=1492737 RepID=A0AAC9N6Q7_9FLAO|nr:polysaccharide lyase family 8 super-sandwich domain-containing protein [Flavobacterium gilvum]AOW10587.1 hypothetical protein EM308_14410 [Flavobacterium gilvum]KFC58437.1 hypothetical protein FEM08_27860 [Flavobacterium gilvum]
MKKKITQLLFYLFLISGAARAQITIDTGHFNWSKIEDASPISVVNTDADNGDGLNDGAMVLKSAATTPSLQGLQYQLAGSPVSGEQINLEVNYYQIGTAYVKFKMQVYNVTDNLVLAESPVILTATGGVGTTPLSYTFTASSVGDQIIVRFVRADDLNITRQAGIDYLKVNGQFISMQAPPINFDVSDFAWSKIEDATPVSVIKTDADNGDGLNDGAIALKEAANTPALQGVQYLLTGSPFANGQINIETKYWQLGLSFCKFKIQVYDVTDNVVLVESPIATTGSGVVGTLTFSYVFTASSNGDQIMLRFVRADDLNPVRQAGLDYVKVNGQFIDMLPVCKPVFNFDLPLTTATPSEISDLAAIRASLSDQLLGTTPPTSAQLDTAINDYNALNITVNGNTITGNPLTTSAQVNFLKTFARYLKFNPNDTNISDKAVKAVWYLSDLFCNKGTSPYAAIDFYSYPVFSRAAVFLNNYLPDNVKNLFGNSLAIETNNFQNLFDPNYDFNTTQTNGAIITDHIYLHSDVYMAYSDWFKTNDEKIRFLKTAKRFVERFTIYTAGTADGLKKDGLGNHHNNSYDGYMYAYGTATTVLKSMIDTRFQIDQPSYLRFRDAIYAQVMYSNDAGVKPFSMAGRNPQTKTTTLSSGTLGNLAIVGGKILGLPGADPILAGAYNRKYGVNPLFNNSTVTPFEEGFVQFNYANLGIYRKNNWIASMRGQSNVLWGSEIYIGNNRFGRYQGYGALDIIYPGNSTTGNGYSDIGWDWNYNPGATTIVLPWSKLNAEKERIDEFNTYGFAGSLTLGQANKSVLSKTIGQSGLFGMKFKEKDNPGFGAVYGPNTHNGTFEFTKAYFTIDDMIICLGNGIKNNDATNPTVTTLSQRLNNNSNDVLVNGEAKTNQATDSFEGTSANWIIDNYSTGFYILPNSGTLKIKNSTQITPYQNQLNPSDATIASNNGNNYRLAYLDHGTAPTNSSYEYVCIPSADAGRMTQFAQQMQSDRPYTVYQNNANQQIIEHKASKTWAYALPAVNTAITDGLLKANDTPCLVMYKSLNTNYSEIVLSVSNPDMGTTPSTPKMITLTLNSEWAISQGNTNANLGTATAAGTTITFTLADGFPVEIKLKAVNPCTLPNATPVAPTLEITQPNCTKATGNIKVTSAVENLSFGLDGTTFENTTGLFENVAPGTFNVYAKNTNGCISTASNAVINVQPAKPDAPTLEVTQPTCTTATGSIQVTGAVENLSFGLDGTTFGNTTGLFENLASGDYTVYVKNADGCISVATNATINVQPATPAAPTLEITQPTCTTATGTIQVTGTIENLSFSLDGTTFENTTGLFGNLTSGDYIVYAKNAAGCISVAANATINVQPATPVAPTLQSTQPTCTTSTGSIAVTSAVENLSFSLDGTTFENTTGLFDNLTSRDYTVYAKNAAGCISLAANATINAQPATPVAPTLQSIQPTCTTSTGSIAVTSAVENLSFSLDGTTFENTTGLFDNLTSRDYTVYAKNAAGCISLAANATINAQPATPAAPTVETIQPTYTVATGSISVTSSTLNLSFGLDGVTFDNTSGSFENLNSGTYTVYAKNANGCISGGTTAVIKPQPLAPTVSFSSPANNASYESLATITINANAADADGSVSKVEFFNGTTKLGEDLTAPYSFNWNNVPSGSYSLTAKATDNNGAVTTSTNVNVNVVCPTVALSIPDVYAMNPAIDDKNTIYLGYGPTSLTLNSLVQGNQDVTYTWNTGAHTPSISVTQAGVYTVTASYAGGCQSTASITINTLDVRCGNNNDKVMICHNNTVICVAQSAVQNHLNHGDNLGSCNGTSKMATKEEVTTSPNFTVYPNPVQDNFNVSISSKLDPNATIGIYNILGNKIRQVRFTTIPQNTFVGDLPSGNYIVVIQNGVETFRSTIVKQ